VINAYEGKADLTPEAVREFPRLHPRAAQVPPVRHGDQHPRLLLHPEGKLPADEGAPRLPLIPAIAGISYEVLRLSAKKTSPLVSALVAPGMWLQRLTTGSRTCPDRGGDRVVPACCRGAGVESPLWDKLESPRRGYRSWSGCCRTRRSREPRRCRGSGGELAELRPVAAATPVPEDRAGARRTPRPPGRRERSAMKVMVARRSNRLTSEKDRLPEESAPCSSEGSPTTKRIS